MGNWVQDFTLGSGWRFVPDAPGKTGGEVGLDPIEVSPAHVAGPVLAAANDALELVRRDLHKDFDNSALKLRWFKGRPLDPPGLVLGNAPGVIWVKADVAADEVGAIVLHEARHAYQHKAWVEGGDPLALDTDRAEADAQAYEQRMINRLARVRTKGDDDGD